MASIAYISDQNMLQYHRLNGSESIVFWRISNKNFASFQPGDLLFFLPKGNEFSRRNEKGIIGCGSYVSKSTLSVETLWKKYKKATGYNSKDELIDAIKNTSKIEEIPEKISCLHLNKVVFFQTPLYLSDLGAKISNKLESYTYLDKEDKNITLKLLKEAYISGEDIWSVTINNKKNFEKLIMVHQLYTIYDQWNLGTSYKNTALSSNLFETYRPDMWLNQNKQSFIKDNDVYYIFAPQERKMDEEYLKMLGELDFLQYKYSQCENSEMIKIYVLSNIDLPDDMKKLISKKGYEYHHI